MSFAPAGLANEIRASRPPPGKFFRLQLKEARSEWRGARPQLRAPRVCRCAALPLGERFFLRGELSASFAS